MASGGDILEIDCKHPVLGQFKFNPKSGEDSEFDLGGYRSNDDANGITAQGSMIDQINRVRWMFNVAIEWDDINGNEAEDLAALQQSPVLGEWTIRRINGKVYRGTGKPVGDIKPNGNNSTISFKVSGGGVLEPIS